MPMTRQDRVNLHTKQERLQIASGVPLHAELKESVPVLRKTNEGLVEYVKHNNVLFKNVWLKELDSVYNVDSDISTLTDKAATKIPLTPDYDSGWVQLNKDTTITLTHNLGLTTIPTLLQSYISPVASPTIGTNLMYAGPDASNENNGWMVEITTLNTVKVFSGVNGLFDSHTFGDPNFSDIDDGYVKVLIWK